MRSLRHVACLATLWVAGCATAPPRYAVGPPERHTSRLSAQSDTHRHWLSVCREVEGRPYRAGGTDPEGFDCSGLVRYAYRRFDGRTLPRTTRDLFRTGQPVERVRAGDLLFYGAHSRPPTHVGIYLWDGWFLHAARSGVTLSSTREPYYAKRYLGARRP